jgi:hypothetical protein
MTPTSSDFGTVQTGLPSDQQTFLVNNGTSAALTMVTTTVAGANPTEFAMSSTTCTSSTMASGTSCTMTIQFAPATPGAKAASVTVAWSGGSLAASLTGTAVASAPPRVRGSDTLYGLVGDLLAACPGASGVSYLGGGSALGEAAMAAGSQTVAPMTTFLSVAETCPSATSTQLPEGLVVGLDGIRILGAQTTSAAAACNGAAIDCDPATDPTAGLAHDTTINLGTRTYTFADWRDVLRVLFAGMDHSMGSDITRRDCASPVRKALASQYGALFENNCTAPAGDGTGGVCTQIRHVFRPDDFSGTTNLIVALLGLPSVVLPDTPVRGTLQHTGASPFCNAVRPAFVYPAGSTPTVLQGSDATYDPTSKNVAANGRETAVYRAVYQDNDPIRRTCAGSGGGTGPAEDVCSHSGDLGLVLPIADVERIAPRTLADAYNAAPCAAGKFISVAAPDVWDAITQHRSTISTLTAGISTHKMLSLARRFTHSGTTAAGGLRR